jgi:DNA-binding CsgD family transcriptional regulator
MTGKFDAVRVLEAAYDLQPDNERWLSAVTTALAPGIDRGVGTLSFIVDIQDRVHAREKAGDAGLIGIVSESNDTDIAQSTDFVRPLYFGAPGAFSLRGLVGDETVDDLLKVSPQMTAAGAVDVFLVRAMNLNGQGFIVGALASSPTSTTTREQRALNRIAAHMTAGFRLRGSLSSCHADQADGEAVLSPDGRLLHASGKARSRTARDALRDAVVTIDKARTRDGRADVGQALDLWKGLVCAEWSLVDRFDSDGRRFVVAHKNHAPVQEHEALTPREGHVAAHIAAGLSNKLAAYSLGLSEGAVAGAVTQVLHKLRLKGRAELLGVGAVLGVAWLQGEGRSRVAATEIRAGSPPAKIAFASSPTAPILSQLSPAEREVATAIMEGRTHEEIAIQRGVSKHTVANQAAAIYRRLGIAGRAELIALAHSKPPANWA